jgi:hypothetical protein
MRECPSIRYSRIRLKPSPIDPDAVKRRNEWKLNNGSPRDFGTAW